MTDCISLSPQDIATYDTLGQIYVALPARPSPNGAPLNAESVLPAEGVPLTDLNPAELATPLASNAGLIRSATDVQNFVVQTVQRQYNADRDAARVTEADLRAYSAAAATPTRNAESIRADLARSINRVRGLVAYFRTHEGTCTASRVSTPVRPTAPSARPAPAAGLDAGSMLVGGAVTLVIGGVVGTTAALVRMHRNRPPTMSTVVRQPPPPPPPPTPRPTVTPEPTPAPTPRPAAGAAPNDFSDVLAALGGNANEAAPRPSGAPRPGAPTMVQGTPTPQPNPRALEMLRLTDRSTPTLAGVQEQILELVPTLSQTAFRGDLDHYAGRILEAARAMDQGDYARLWIEESQRDFALHPTGVPAALIHRVLVWDIAEGESNRGGQPVDAARQEFLTRLRVDAEAVENLNRQRIEAETQRRATEAARPVAPGRP